MENNTKQNITLSLMAGKKKFFDEIPALEKEHNIMILLAYVRGSHLYGTATETSDVDVTFVYIQKTDEILKGNYIPQLSIGGEDIVGYEIERYLELLNNNNPNIIESLDITPRCLIYKHVAMNLIDPKDWISKLTQNTIVGYAENQVKKATGLNKNMNTPQPKERKSILEFCYVIQDGNTVPFLQFFERYQHYSYNNIDYTKWGLVKMDNGKQLYTLYPNLEGEFFRGLVKEDSVNLRMSDIPYVTDRECYTFVYNLDGFEVHCKQHKAYWQWVEERNEERHLTNNAHGKNYDSKNMMHLFRLLDMAFNIAFEGKLTVESHDVDWLMEIRRGEVDYDTLISDANELKILITSLYEMSELPERPDLELMKNLLLTYRKSTWIK